MTPLTDIRRDHNGYQPLLRDPSGSAVGALIAAGTLASLLLRTGNSRTHRRGPMQHITQNITATGLFGRASGTLNNR
ncbi:hypothetical protein ABT224_30665 [Streptomyces sp. NPDC001584]|uniref:hypothetical protein n=1 Tax=Streptomyces sp. NPDC001584 TaxID=3154521 RepID=UPI00332B2ABD